MNLAMVNKTKTKQTKKNYNADPWPVMDPWPVRSRLWTHTNAVIVAGAANLRRKRVL